MARFNHIGVAAFIAILLGAVVAPAAATPTARSPIDLALSVERRAGATDFSQLERFGFQATAMKNREGLNRIYHVTWILLNQGEFGRAARWNERLTQAAMAQDDRRYLTIARLNDLAIRYKQGELTAAADMQVIAASETDWFAKAHATRLTAHTLIDQDRIGEALKLLADIDAMIPDADPYADTARAGLWEVSGLGLMKLNDFAGSVTAFGLYEIDLANPAYPRPDFDSLYNMARLAVQLGDKPLADRLYAAHHRLSVRAGIESLSVYDANLCAMVANARQAPRDVLACLAPYGQDLGAAAFLAPSLLPLRAIAYAQTGQVDAARRDVDEIHRRVAMGGTREEGFGELPHAEAELLFAEARPTEAYAKLRDYFQADSVRAARRFSAGIRQVTGDMQQKLNERRNQLETARSNTALQQDVIRSQNWIVGIAVLFFVSAAGALAWQFRLSRHLRTARRRAEAASRSKSEFLANMSHEIRTPLNGIVAMADTLSRARLEPREHEMAEVIRTSGITLERLLSDILDTARIESGQVTIEPTPFHLGEAVRGIAALWQPPADKKGVALTIDIDPALDGMVQGDPVRIRQVLTNLVSNALKFTAAGSVRLTAARTDGGLVRFTVVDTGVGFDDGQKDRIFGRFQQADGSITRRFGGTGLGLAISRDLAELMGGTLDCHSSPGHGATFHFDVPLPRAEVMTSDADAAEIGVVGMAMRILLADDHPANRKVIEIMLSETEAELVMVENGQEALDAFAAGAFDLVLMDMQMPVMDGLTATAAIRALETERGGRRTPLLMLTANALADHVTAGHEAGADGHLAKPITMTSLFGAIDAAMKAVDLINEQQAA